MSYFDGAGFGGGGSGGAAVCYERAQRRKRKAAAKAAETVPVFANRAPWNELLIRGQRKVKTLSRNWKHRGPVLLYTSSNRQDSIFGLTYKLPKNMKVEDFHLGAIVGTAEVVDVVPETEFSAVLHPFGDSGSKYEAFFKHDPNLTETLGQSHVVIVQNVKRFKKPIPFKPPQGAVRIFRAPAKLLKRATV